MSKLKLLIAAAILALAATPLSAAELRIGLEEDPDVLDPDQSRTFVGRIVYASLCDKLIDITPDLKIIPMLATEWTWSDDGSALTMKLREGVKFHDGTDFNAEAAKANLERSMNLKESRRKSEVASIAAVEVSGDHEIKITLKAPDATLLAQLADRAGMMISPRAAEEQGLDFGNAPVCSGPFKFVERVQQDRIVLEKFADYWNKDTIFIDKVTFLPIPDATVRLANLRSGDLDMIERVAATDAAAVKTDANLQYAEAVSIGYQGITANVGNGERAKTPFGQDKRVRQALSLAIDREALNQVVFEGAFRAGNQPFPPNSPWYDKSDPVPARDIEKAKALLKEAGHETITVEIQSANSSEPMRVAQVVQAMASEAGINVEIRTTEFATLLKEQTAGNYTLSQIGWSGRIDPDGNLHQFVTCKGGINDSKYCNPEVDKLLNEARVSTDPEVRKKSYDAARAILAEDLPLIYLYHQTWIWGLSKEVEGFVPYPDGMIRLQNVKIAG
jgi:peptide/nickel transport system substrate-binding protein